MPKPHNAPTSEVPLLEVPIRKQQVEKILVQWKDAVLQVMPEILWLELL